MVIKVISKYSQVPEFGANPRWFELAKFFERSNVNISIVTSDSNHNSLRKRNKARIDTISFESIDFFVIRTLQYRNTASLSRVLSWFDFDLKLFWYFWRKTPDVVIISSLSLTSIIFGIYLKWRYRSCLVFEVRDIWPLTMIHEGGFSRWHPLVLYLRWIELWGYRRADLVVGTMPNLKQHVNDSGIRKPDDAFHTCGIGVAPDRAADVAAFSFSLEVEALLRGRTIIGYCGSIGLTNNLHDFVRYMDDCTRDDVAFVIAGDGADRQTFQSRLKHHQNVVFLGKIAPEQVQGFLRRCDVLFLSTLPSKVWDYGQSMNKVVDYMLAGKYIVAQYTGFPSFINEAGCGVFTDGEGLAKSLDAALDMSAAARDAAGMSGREWLLATQNYETLARDYLRRIEDCFETGR